MEGDRRMTRPVPLNVAGLLTFTHVAVTGLKKLSEVRGMSHSANAMKSHSCMGSKSPGPTLPCGAACAKEQKWR
jgi:hypothetical protein